MSHLQLIVCMLNLKKSFLAPGLVLCGDSACVSNEHDTTPHKNASSGSKGACNFHQSQVRIYVEQSFGMLVRRWEILRGPTPANMRLRNAAALAR